MATVTATEFARLFGMTVQRVSDLIALGLPAGGRGKRGSPRQIDVPLAVDWMIARAVARVRTPDGGESIEAADLRFRRAAADLAEIRAAEAANRVINMDDVLQLIDRMMVMAGSQIDALSGRLAGRVAAESDPAVCRKIIFDEGRAIRSAMSNEFTAMADREAGIDVPEPQGDA